MSFLCQRDSYAKEYDAEVVSCKAASLSYKDDSGKKLTVKGVEVICDDSVLFPEGGGQNSDRGSLDGHKVLQVTRKGQDAVIFVQNAVCEELKVGQKVKQEVDWTRRFDNMQQHTGQHVLSAILERDFNLPTTAWWMAENTQSKVQPCFVELEGSVTEEIKTEAERKCNMAIRQALDVQVKMCQIGDPGLDAAHTRGLPDDLSGPVRIISIGDVDSNLCCGTHVSNLAQLQIIKLLGWEKSKREGRTNLYFLVGDRAINYLEKCYKREEKLTAVLNGGPDDHVALAEKLAANSKITAKSLQNVTKELALKDSAEANSLNDSQRYFVRHKKDCDVTYTNVLLSEITNKDLFVCIITGDDKSGPCQLTMVGRDSDIKALGKTIIDACDGKGGGKGTRMNAKVNKVNLVKIEDMLQSHFKLTE